MILVCVTVALCGGTAAGASPEKARPFDLNCVRLLDGPFKEKTAVRLPGEPPEFFGVNGATRPITAGGPAGVLDLRILNDTSK
jgi:hypothetical protein